MTNTKTEKTLWKKLIMIVVPAILTIIMSLSLLSACSKTPPTNNNSDETNAVTDEELIRERVETFISAYNEGDMDTVLECLDAKSRNAMEAMLKLLGGIAGSYTGFEIDLKDLFSLGISTIDGDFMKLKITDIKITDSKNATVTTTMELTGAGVQTIFFSMVYEHEGWYIRDMSDKSSSSGGSSTVTDAFYVSTYSNTALSGTAGTYTTYNREKFDVGTKVVLEASANDGFNFEGWYTTQNWSSICLSTNPRYEFEMKAEDVNIEARFSYYTVTTSSSSDEQGTAGTYTKLNEQKTSIGKTVVLEATVNDGFNFEGWYKGDVCMSTDLRYEFEMKEEDVDIEAKFSYYTVTTYCESDERGTAGTYTKFNEQKTSIGKTVVLEATVNDGFNFEGWYMGDVCMSTDLRYEFEMKAENVYIEARYSYYTVTTFSWSDEYGTAGTYTKFNEQKTSIGKTVVLEATVNDGFNFEGWYMGDVCMSTDLRYEFEMKEENVDIEARYSYYTVTTFSWWDYGTAGTYTKKEAEKISVGETVTLVATVNSGYRFEGWFRNGVCVSKSLTYTFKMDSCSVDIEAAWSEILS